MKNEIVKNTAILAGIVAGGLIALETVPRFLVMPTCVEMQFPLYCLTHGLLWKNSWPQLTLGLMTIELTAHFSGKDKLAKFAGIGALTAAVLGLANTAMGLAYDIGI